MRKFFVSRLMGRSAEDLDPFPILELPEQLVEYVLSFVSTDDLVKSCRLVCVQFQRIVDRNGFWKIKCERDGKVIPSFHLDSLPANYYRAIYVSNPYGRNLLRNGHGDEKGPDNEASQLPSKTGKAVAEGDCSDVESSGDEHDEMLQAARPDPTSAGPDSEASQLPSKTGKAVAEGDCSDVESSGGEHDEMPLSARPDPTSAASSSDGEPESEPPSEDEDYYEDDFWRDMFAHWQVTQNHGDGWRVEKTPAGADPLPLANQSCFATSYGECSKEQVISLVKEGVVPEVLDIFKPAIEVSEWYAGRFDCGCKYRLIVELLNVAKKPVATFDTGELVTPQWAGRQWQQVRHTFNDYPKGVRYVRFAHLGTDTQFWAGHYGAKMAGGMVRIAAEQTNPPPTAASRETADKTSGAQHS
uniref:Putative f-box associated region n=1 Tax=Ixodes ricinus TaxID=34613 RepID=V5III4_IXORI